MTKTPEAPIAKKTPFTITEHGHSRVDDYYWMRERTNAEVIAYLETENAYTESVMAHTKELQEELYQEMVGRIQETDEDAPYRYGGYYYYTRTVEGLQYPIHCRKPGSLEAEEEILLDLNELAKEHDYLVLGVFEVSPDHNMLAYSLDTSGSEEFIVYFKDLTTGELLPDRIENTKFDGEWTNDKLHFFYTTQDEAKRDYRLHRHKIGTSTEEDDLLYQEDDELFWVSLGKTRDQAFLVLTSASIETSEVRVLDANKPHGELSLIHPREKELLYFVSHHQGTFYIRTNDNAKNYKIVTTPVTKPAKEHWREWVPHREDVLISDIDLFADHLVIYKRQNGLKTIGVTHLSTNETHHVAFPEPAYTYEQEKNREFNTNLVRFTYMSMSTPDTVYDYDMVQRTLVLKKRKPVLGDFASDNYITERLFASADDGAKIPISVVYRKGLKMDGSNPCLLYGYGAYGASMEPYFGINQISLLDRGFVFAIAHIRGGQELGRYWYDEGKYLNKKNTFTDFITCGRYLTAEKYTRPGKLSIMGASAGGLLIGSVLNMAPDLCHGAIAKVPFIDVVTTMLDESIPLTVAEFEEWGNPKDEEYYHYMLSYSPYDNVEAKVYPHILITAGLNDPRVSYWEPAKWTAKLRGIKTDNNRLLLKTNMGAGHFSASGRYEYLREIAFNYAFLVDTLLGG
jgi:oligopeptidase B